ncbi:PH domain-containing protein [Kitasatospora sp. NPDC093806]|uniref:PH domain-containing protein n=1 Tax=Kitasatospora sp. NPDC093806 TaxID=3155075 RepID=UPI00344542F7
MGATQELPRRYRADGRQLGLVLLVLGLKTLLVLFIVWTDDFPRWVQLLTTTAVLLFDLAVLAAVPWSGTYADHAGLRSRGFLRTRRLAWSQIADIRSEPMGHGSLPSVVAYAYPTTGRRMLLVHLNDQHLDSPAQVEREVNALRAAARQTA